MDNPEALTTSGKQVTGRKKKRKRKRKDDQHRFHPKKSGVNPCDRER